MDDLNGLAQGSPDQQRRVTDMVLQGIKDIFPSLPLNLKDSVSLNKAREGEGDWAVEKEILGSVCGPGSPHGLGKLTSLLLHSLRDDSRS